MQHILQHLQVASIHLLSNNPDKSAAFNAWGLVVAEVVKLEIESNRQNAHYLATKKHKLGHQLTLVADHLS